MEYINKNKFKKVYVVDINQFYLNECKKRYPNLSDILITLKKDLMNLDPLPNVNLLIANLLIEYVGYYHFTKAVVKANPNYVSCVIQFDNGESYVSQTQYLSEIHKLDEVHQYINEEELVNAMKSVNYSFIDKIEFKLKNSKKFLRLDFIKNHL